MTFGEVLGIPEYTLDAVDFKLICKKAIKNH